MTISHAASTGVSTTSAARGTTSTTVAYVGVAAGRMGVLTVSTKPSTATFPATVTDGGGRVWDRVADATGGTGTNAADTGTSRCAKYIRVFDGTETGNVTVTASNSPSQVCGAMDVYSTTNAWLSPLAVTGSDTTHGTNPSATSGTWSSALAAGDWVNVGYATDTDATNTASAHAISQTSTTFGTVTERSRVGNSDGNDGSVFTWDASVSSGGATSALTMSMTWAANSCGAFAAVRLREATGQSLSATVLDSFGDGTIDTGAWDPWGGAQITESGGTLRLATTTTAGGYYGIARLATIDLSSQYSAFRLVDAGNQALASYTAYVCAFQFSTNNEAYWTINGGMVRFFTNVGGTQTQRVIFPYLTDTHKRFALGFAAGNLHALWSKDGSTWVSEYSIANPYSGDTVGIGYGMVGTDAVEGSTTTLQLDDYSTLSGLTEVTKSYELPWTVQQNVTKSYTLPWTTQQTIVKSVQLEWTVRNTAVRSYELDWVVRNLITRSYELDWQTRQTITSSYTLPWTTRHTLTRSYELDWLVRTTTTRSYEIDWVVRVLAARSYELDWFVRQTIVASAQLEWLVRNGVARSYELPWTVRVLAARSYELNWVVRQTIARGYTLDWLVRAIAVRSYELEWLVRAVIVRSYELPWAVRVTVLRSYELLWDVDSELVQVTKTYELLWRVQQTITASVDLRWTVRQVASRSYELDWVVRVGVLRSYELPWVVRVLAARSYELRWTSSARVLRSYELRWIVESDASPTPLPADVVARLGSQATADIGGDVVRSYVEKVVTSGL